MRNTKLRRQVDFDFTIGETGLLTCVHLRRHNPQAALFSIRWRRSYSKGHRGFVCGKKSCSEYPFSFEFAPELEMVKEFKGEKTDWVTRIFKFENQPLEE